jgi:hypothetical protein
LTAQKVPAIVQWALHGKAHDAEGYRILSCSTGELSRAHFADALSRFTMAAADSLPQVAVSYLKHGTDPGTTYLGLTLTYSDSAQRHGDAVAARDVHGRETTFTSYFCTPYRQLAQAGVTYWDMYEAFGAINLPVSDGPPREITITGSPARNPAVEDLAMRAAALLLTGTPVCVLGADSTRMEERLRFIDTVMDLLPYGYHARMTAATWTKATNRTHKFRLFFSTAPRSVDRPDHIVAWDAPDQVAIPSGPAADYYELLSEKLTSISRLRTLTKESRFGSREAVQAYEHLDTGRFRIWRPQGPPWLGGDRRPLSPPHGDRPDRPGRLADRPGQSGRPVPQAQALPQPQAHQLVRPAVELDAIEQALAACAAKIKDGNPSGLRGDVKWLENQAKSAPIDDARRQRYRALIGTHKLLAQHPGLRIEAELAEVLLILAFGRPVTYEGYCKLEHCLGVERGARLHQALVNAILRVGTANLVVSTIVHAHADTVELNAWLKSSAPDVVTMINLLGGKWDHPAHAQLFCDVTLAYLKLFPDQYNQTAVRKVLRQRGFLASTLQQRHPGSYQYAALHGFLLAAYPDGLDDEAVVQVLTGGNNPPPTPALFAAVLKLKTGDEELVWRAYLYGSATLLGVDSATFRELVARIPDLEPRRALAAAPTQDIDPDPLLGRSAQLRAGRRSEDVMGSNAPPDDVRLAWHAFGSVAEGGAAVVVPGHLEHVRMGFHAFDPQARPERPVRGHQVRHEGVPDHLKERSPLLRLQVLPVFLETRQRLERRHQASAASSSRCANMSSADSCTVPSPAAISSSASRSPASHCGVKNHA